MSDLPEQIDRLTASYQALSDRLDAIEAKISAKPATKLSGDAGKALVAQIKASHGLTAQTLATQLGVSVRTVQGWEQGRVISVVAQRALRVLHD
jgi:DNA-binding transcriptional regulator YiaG